jgi:hypothetical protein
MGATNKKPGSTVGRTLITILGVFAALVTILAWLRINPPSSFPKIGDPTNTQTPVPAHEHIAVVSYFDPGAAWIQVEHSTPQVGLAILNPDSGPGAGPDPDFANQVRQTTASGIPMIGYVDTAYAGTNDSSRTLAAVEQDILHYYQWYPGISGIFVDEVTTDCAHMLSYYQPLYRFIKAKDGQANVVLDPGSTTAECYLQFAGDIIVEYEDTYAQYNEWTSAGWESKYPATRFWHIIYDTKQRDVLPALQLAQSRHVGWIYITDNTLPDPFASLPTYWNYEVDVVGRTS